MLEPVENTDYFRFMDLPPELRKMVYDLVLLEKTEKVYLTAYKAKARARRPVKPGFRDHSERYRRKYEGITWDKDNGKWIGVEPSALSLLRVSKDLLAETAPIVYGDHTFNFGDMGVMECFLSHVGNMRQYLRSLELSGHSYFVTKCRRRSICSRTPVAYVA